MKNIICLILALALPLTAAVIPPPGGAITVREDGTIKGRVTDVDFIDSTVIVTGQRAAVTPPGAGGGISAAAATNIVSAAVLTVNVKNFGALGDTVQSSASFSSNSIYFTNSTSLVAGDIGKKVLIFKGGVTNGDFFATITNVSSGVGLVNTVISNSFTNALAFIGTDDTIPLHRAYQRVRTNGGGVVQFPAGRYWLLSTNFLNLTSASNGYVKTYALSVDTNNITFEGLGGAEWFLPGGYRRIDDGTNFVARASGFETSGSVTNLTFRGLTVRTGITNAWTSYTAFPARTPDGDGWDTSHKFFLADTTFGVQTVVTFERMDMGGFKGEMITTSLGTLVVKNCVFTGGNASILNPHGQVLCSDTTFRHAQLVSESGQFYSQDASVYSRCTISNVASGFTFVGANTNATAPALIRDCYFFGVTNYAITSAAAKHLTIDGNKFINCAIDIQDQSGGVQGNETDSKFVLVQGNDFIHTNNTGVGVFLAAARSQNWAIRNNRFLDCDYAFYFGGYLTNNVFEDNFIRSGKGYGQASAVVGEIPLCINNQLTGVGGTFSGSTFMWDVNGASKTNRYAGELALISNTGANGMFYVTAMTNGVPDKAEITFRYYYDYGAVEAHAYRFSSLSNMFCPTDRFLRTGGDALVMRYSKTANKWYEKSYVADPLWKRQAAAPTTGYWAAGEVIESTVQSNTVFQCLVAGNPGTWFTNVGVNGFQVRAEGPWTTLSSNAFTWIAPGGIIKTGIIGSNLSFDPATGTISATGSGDPATPLAFKHIPSDGTIGSSNITAVTSTNIFTDNAANNAHYIFSYTNGTGIAGGGCNGCEINHYVTNGQTTALHWNTNTGINNIQWMNRTPQYNPSADPNTIGSAIGVHWVKLVCTSSNVFGWYDPPNSGYTGTGATVSSNAPTLYNPNLAGTTTLDVLSVGTLVVTSNVLEFAASANHQIDLNVAPRWNGSNSLAQATALSYTNIYKTTNSSFQVDLEGAAAGGSNYEVTNLLGSAIGSVPTLFRVEGAAPVTSFVDTVTNGTTVAYNGLVLFRRGTNFVEIYRRWGVR